MKRFGITIVATLLAAGTALAAEFTSHPPMRPLPEASKRALPEDSRLLFVDPKSGADENDGSKAKPWKTLAHATRQLLAGDTLVLSGGVYHEHAIVRVRATVEKPVTIRSASGELAILDGGLPEFLASPQTAWEPVENGAADEFQSTRVYPSLGEQNGATNLLGAFADSMIPLHGYRFLTDLRSPNEYFGATAGGKTEEEQHIYCGPGLWYNPETNRIHVRLSHTTQTCLKSTGDNYAGETDPRKIPLIVARLGQSTLLLEEAANVILQDLVVRGSREATLSIVDSANITLDGVTAYGGSSAMRVASTSGLRGVDSAFRGIAAPWTWRGSLKYRAIEAKIVAASSWSPSARPNRDFEFANCEFTDCVDGVFIGGVEGVKIHHSLLDNLSDDGFFVTCGAAYDGTTPGGDVRIYENRLSRCLTTFAFGVGHGRQRTIDAEGHKQLGKGIWIYRNIFDFRRPVHYQQPGEGEPDILTYGRVAGDHGGPGWEPMFYYHNTFLSREPAFRNYFAGGLGGAMGRGTSRRVINNIFYQFNGMPGQVLAEGDPDFAFGGNLHWSAELGEAGVQTWKLTDRYDDPKFAAAPRDWRETPDLRPAAAGVGVSLEPDWPISSDSPIPGATPAGAEPSRVGVRGRLTIFGAAADNAGQTPELTPFLHAPPELPTKRAALVLGYPAFDAPLVQFALEKAGYRVDVFEKVWLPVSEYPNYETIVVTGDLVRAKMEPSGYAESEFPAVQAYLKKGGSLVMMRGVARQLYAGDKGKAELETITGTIPRTAPYEPVIKLDHPWVATLATAPKQPVAKPKPVEVDVEIDLLAPPKPEKKNALAPVEDDRPFPWIRSKTVMPLPLPNGENVIGDPSGASILGRVRVGEGQLIHIGWIPSAALPEGRSPSTLEQELAYEEQYQVLERVLIPHPQPSVR